MVANNRDEFSEPTKRTLAERVGWKCSFPNCGQITVGPSLSDSSARINNGVAAHICAASPNGPRFDPLMTPEQRKHIDNGIWMCRDHGSLIDSDFTIYSVSQLKEWKLQAENLAHTALSNPYMTLNINDPYEENVLRNRAAITSYYQDVNSFGLFSSPDGKSFVLRGFDPIEIYISPSDIEVYFNTDIPMRPRCGELHYIDRVSVDFLYLFDKVVLSRDPHESVFDFYIRFSHDEGYFSIMTRTEGALYSGDYHMNDSVLYDDCCQKIQPRQEIIYKDVISFLYKLSQGELYGDL
ncbi:hypothetical protein [Aeromonas veronii]|uniref:hypothetical protein n=1 Tax=Aeromonas veronii TaxID=654 RepID=UPI001116B871|nr:hypothetical protein [Aeromonas veronii]